MALSTQQRLDLDRFKQRLEDLNGDIIRDSERPRDSFEKLLRLWQFAIELCEFQIETLKGDQP